MKAMIFAAGLGTRLRPITDKMPKALVPVCGEPLLAHVIRKLAAAGYDSLTVNVHHFPDQIIGYLQEHDFGVQVTVSDERDHLLETGGGIRHARPFLEGGPFLVHNVDIVSDLDLEWFRARHRPGDLATLLVSERKTSRYLLFGPEDGLLKGWTNVSTGEVRSPYPDLDPATCRPLAFSGIHYLSEGIFDAFDALDMPERFPIMDFYLKACREYPIRAAVPQHLTLVDVGKIDTLADAERICATLL